MVLRTPHKARLAAMPCWVFDTEEEADAKFKQLAQAQHLSEAALAVLANRDKAHEQAARLIDFLISD